MQRRYVEQNKYLLRLCFRRSFEESRSNFSIKIGDSSQMRLGVTHNEKGCTLPNRPYFGRPERSEGSPPFPRKGPKNQLICRLERSEASPPFYVSGWSWRRGLIPPPFIVMSSEARHLLFNRKGENPFPTDTKCRPERLL